MNEINSFIRTVKIDNLTPASYNPRKLSDNAQENLIASLNTLGIIKAIVIRANDGLILAGHQRTKTMRKIGITECPAFCLGDVSKHDEARFNQLHNYTEVEVTENAPMLQVNIPQGKTGWYVVEPKDIVMLNKGGEAEKVVILSQLISKHGQFANCVCDCNGNIIISALYAKAIKLLRMPLLVYILPEGMEQKAVYYFSQDYGAYYYGEIERNTYIQSFAQLHRTTEDSDKGQRNSTLYEKLVIPYIKGNKEIRILDFGAGLKGYYKQLKREGYNIDAIEFFYVGVLGKSEILIDQVERDCKEICRHIKEYGLYDIVVCDSVLNSVDSLEAERSVLRTLSALCKPNGTIFWSGIPLAETQAKRDATRGKDHRGFFLDENNFTATLRGDVWYFQHYHTRDYVEKCNRENIGNKFDIFNAGVARPTGELTGGSFQVKALNERVADKSSLLEAVKFEFTLPLPKKQRYELDKYILPILEEKL